MPDITSLCATYAPMEYTHDYEYTPYNQNTNSLVILEFCDDYIEPFFTQPKIIEEPSYHVFNSAKSKLAESWVESHLEIDIQDGALATVFPDKIIFSSGVLEPETTIWKSGMWQSNDSCILEPSNIKCENNVNGQINDKEILASLFTYLESIL